MVLKQDPWLQNWLLNQDLSHLGVSQATYSTTSPSVWTVESKHKRITSKTGSADLRVLQNAGFLQSGSQGTSKDQMIESQTLSVGGTSRVLRENDFSEIYQMFQSGETSRYFSLVFCESETFRLLDASPYLDKIPFLKVDYSSIKKSHPTTSHGLSYIVPPRFGTHFWEVNVHACIIT